MRRRRHLDEIQLPLLRVRQGLADSEDADLLPIGPDDPDGRDADAVVDADFFRCGDSGSLL
jgi:hypothetical protein